jgi:hypothetical protein
MKRKLIVVAPALFFMLSSYCQSQKADIKNRAGHYIIQVNGQQLEVDPANGGRISALTVDGRNFLTDSNVNRFNWGSTFWPSPQSDWDWPPSSELDNQPYSAEEKDNVLKMVSRKDPKSGLVVTKEFSGSNVDGAFTLKYTLTNKSDTPRRVAPWEVTRVHTNGIAFFPLGKGEKRGGLLPLTFDKHGICWFTYDSSKVPVKGDSQLYTDGSEGWFAQVNGDLILVKKFPDFPYDKSAPKEAEVELYANRAAPEKSYVEIEHQGSYEQLMPGQSLTWEMTWYLRKLPSNIKTSAGNQSLVDYARKIAQNKIR